MVTSTSDNTRSDLLLMRLDPRSTGSTDSSDTTPSFSPPSNDAVAAPRTARSASPTQFIPYSARSDHSPGAVSYHAPRVDFGWGYPSQADRLSGETQRRRRPDPPATSRNGSTAPRTASWRDDYSARTAAAEEYKAQLSQQRRAEKGEDASSTRSNDADLENDVDLQLKLAAGEVEGLFRTGTDTGYMATRPGPSPRAQEEIDPDLAERVNLSKEAARQRLRARELSERISLPPASSSRGLPASPDRSHLSPTSDDHHSRRPSSSFAGSAYRERAGSPPPPLRDAPHPVNESGPRHQSHRPRSRSPPGYRSRGSYTSDPRRWDPSRDYGRELHRRERPDDRDTGYYRAEYRPSDRQPSHKAYLERQEQDRLRDLERSRHSDVDASGPSFSHTHSHDREERGSSYYRPRSPPPRSSDSYPSAPRRPSTPPYLASPRTVSNGYVRGAPLAPPSDRSGPADEHARAGSPSARPSLFARLDHASDRHHRHPSPSSSSASLPSHAFSLEPSTSYLRPALLDRITPAGSPSSFRCPSPPTHQSTSVPSLLLDDHIRPPHTGFTLNGRAASGIPSSEPASRQITSLKRPRDDDDDDDRTGSDFERRNTSSLAPGPTSAGALRRGEEGGGTASWWDWAGGWLSKRFKSS